MSPLSAENVTSPSARAHRLAGPLSRCAVPADESLSDIDRALEELSRHVDLLWHDDVIAPEDVLSLVARLIDALRGKA